MRYSQPGLATAIRERLVELDMTQTDLASKLHVHESAVSRWLNDRTHKPIPEPNVERIVEALDLDPDKLPKRAEVYVSAPLESFQRSNLNEHQDAVQTLVDALRDASVQVYWPCEGIRSDSPQSLPDLATEANLPHLRDCDAMLLALLAETERTSSAFIELGIALGLGKKVTILHMSDVRLPFMLEGFGQAAERIDYLPEVRLRRVDSLASAEAVIRDNWSRLLPH